MRTNLMLTFTQTLIKEITTAYMVLAAGNPSQAQVRSFRKALGKNLSKTSTFAAAITGGNGGFEVEIEACNPCNQGEKWTVKVRDYQSDQFGPGVYQLSPGLVTLLKVNGIKAELHRHVIQS